MYQERSWNKLKISLLNLERQYRNIKDEADRNVCNVLASSKYIMGENVKAFEKGLIVECAGRKNSVVKIMPALTIDKDLVLKGLEKLKAAVADCLSEI